MKENISTISNNYAKALIEIASEKNSFDLIKKNLKDIIQTINSSEDLRIVLNNSAISQRNKSKIIEEIFNGKIENYMLNFLKLLLENNRIDEISNIYSAFIKISDKFSNIKNVEIISSITLNNETKEHIIEKLQNKLHCGINPNWIVNDDIISGLILKFGDYVIDTSVKTKLEKLSKNILR